MNPALFQMNNTATAREKKQIIKVPIELNNITVPSAWREKNIANQS